MNTIIENTKKVISEVDALVADLEAKKLAPKIAPIEIKKMSLKTPLLTPLFTNGLVFFNKINSSSLYI